MLGWLLLGCVIWVSAKMAEIEGRTPWLWGFGALVGVLILTWGFGMLSVVSNVLALVGVFIALWIAKAIDDKRAGRPF